MRCSRAWSQHDTQAIIESPSARAISAFGVVNVSIRYSGNIKGRKVVSTTKRKVPGDTASAIPKRTTAGHYLYEFSNMKGFHIVIDKAPIHSHGLFGPAIIERGYIPVQLLPYSSELNPVEWFWKVLKDEVKRGKLNDAETLTPRIIEGS